MTRNKYRIGTLTAVLMALFALSSSCQDNGSSIQSQNGSDSDSVVATAVNRAVMTGSENLVSSKMHLLRGKKVAIAANHTAILFDRVHLVDTLHSLGVEIVRIFAPEHGFRGDHDAGATVSSGKDEKTGIPITSLYGRNKKPSAEQLDGVDVVLFEIQDVGARFYTYISTMSYIMEACAENGVQFLVLDRPNPNGWYVDGPTMQKAQTSFIGMHEGVPVAHGMTIGEYARMVNKEGWLSNGVTCTMDVVKCSGYTHSMSWEETGLEWIAPSPNLPNEYSAHLYPMLCFFEGMYVSVGRGTDYPFQIFGAPWHVGFQNSWKADSIAGVTEPSVVDLGGLQMSVLRFTPRSIPGKSTNPKFLGEVCYGAKFENRVQGKQLFIAGLYLIMNHVQETGNVKLTKPLFKSSFNLLAGNTSLKADMLASKKPEDVYQSWQPGVTAFKAIRSKYLLYPDFK